MSAIMLTILLGAVGSVLAAEFLGWCPWIAERLLHHAVRCLPNACRERYRDEWLADMDIMRTRGGLSLVIWAVGVRLIARRIATVLQAREPKNSAAHRHASYAETVRVLHISLRRSRLHVLGRMMGLLALPFLAAFFWLWARSDRRLCVAIQEVVVKSKVDHSTA